MVQAFRPVISRMRGWFAPVACLALCVVAALPAVPALAAERVLPVPRVTIYPGDVIADTMLVDRVFRSPDFEGLGFAGAREELIGKVARQTLLPNAPIAATGIREPFAVKQGQPAVVIFQSGALIISSVAVPLQAGSAGEIISLRNTEAGTTIRGVVQADGTVRVGM